MKAQQAMWMPIRCAWRNALLIALVSVTGTCVMWLSANHWLFASRVNLSDPISTMRTFRDAIRGRQWRIASECLSEEIQRKNADFLDKPALYTVSYWQLSRGMESFLNDEPPLIEKDCQFKILSQEPGKATVEIVYPRSREKAVRLNAIMLVRNAKGLWKISEIFGRTIGVQAAVSTRPQ